MADFQHLIHMTTWAPNILYFMGLIPQIMLNYRLKTCRGMSDLMLLAYVNGYWAFYTYVLVYNLPCAYKIMIPLSIVAVAMILAQRFFYDGFFTGVFRWVFVINVFLLAGASWYAFHEPLFIGSIAGWFNVFIWSVYQVPQVMHMYRAGTTQGFSFALASMYFVGEMIELVAAITLGFPIQTVVNDVRGIFIFLIFCFQFWWFPQRISSNS